MRALRVRPLRPRSQSALSDLPSSSETFAKQAALNEHLKSHNQTPVQQTEQLSVKMARWRNAA